MKQLGYLNLFNSTSWDEISLRISKITTNEVESALHRAGRGGAG